MEQRQVIDVDNYEAQTGVVDLTQDDMQVWTTRRSHTRTNSAVGQMNPYSKRKRLNPEPVFYRYVWPQKVPSGTPAYEVFNLMDSDEDNEPGPSKKRRAAEGEKDGEGSDADGGDYDNYTDGLLMNSSHWKPLPVKKLSDNSMKTIDSDVEMSDELDILSVDASLRLPESEDVSFKRYRRRQKFPVISMQRPVMAERQSMDKLLPWDVVNKVVNVSHWHPLYRESHNDILASALPNTTTRRYSKSSYSHNLSLSSSFKQSPGYIMRIIQQDGWAVVCSTCVGGLPDFEDEESDGVDGSNREGSLIVWHNGKEDIMTGHRRKLSNTEDRYKHYSVNDIKFDPTSTTFVSSGNDRKVRVWKREDDEDDEEYVQDRVFSFTHVPCEVAFKPGTRKLAIAEKRIRVYADYETSVANTSLSVAPAAAEHNVGGMIWGSGPTEHLICASSEPKADDCFEGYHKVFDVERGTSYDLDCKEAGDSIGLTPDGSILVHTSRGPDRKNILRLYDIRRKDGRAIESIHMDPFPPHLDGELNSVSISPDGVYVATTRLDNRIHLYDLRMLTKGKIYQYEHKGPSLTSPNCTSGGIVARWVETEHSRLALVSGSVDGCIRLWHPLEAMSSPRNGTVLAQVHSDIGYMSIGDRTKNEQQLIVGDCSGEVYVFDSTNTYLRPV